MSEHPHVTDVRIYKDDGGEWRWAGLAANGREVADSGEGYTNHDDARSAAESLFPDADIDDELEPQIP